MPSQNLIAAKDPPTPVFTETWVEAKPIHLETDRDDFEKQECVEAGPSEFFILDPKPIPSQQIIGTPGRNLAQISVLTGKRVCVFAHTWAGAVGTKESQTVTLSVLKRSINFK